MLCTLLSTPLTRYEHVRNAYLIDESAMFASVQQEHDGDEKKECKEDDERYEDRQRERLDDGGNWNDVGHVDHHAEHPAQLHTVQLPTHSQQHCNSTNIHTDTRSLQCFDAVGWAARRASGL